MIIFVGLTLIYATEIPTRLLSWNPGSRVIGLFHTVSKSTDAVRESVEFESATAGIRFHPRIGAAEALQCRF